MSHAITGYSGVPTGETQAIWTFYPLDSSRVTYTNMKLETYISVPLSPGMLDCSWMDHNMLNREVCGTCKGWESVRPSPLQVMA